MNQLALLPQRLLQFSPDALLAVGADGVILFANETTYSLFGYTPEQLVGKTLDVLVPDRYRARHGALVDSYRRDPSNREMGARSNDLFARRADGTEFPAGIRLAPFQVDGVQYVAAAVRDMTERRAMNDALVAARAEADRANRAKSRFLATASHDLRQPMHAIRLLNASMTKLAPETASLHELLRRQDQAIDSATRLLDALLDISRLESGAIDPQLSAVSLASLFADLQREFEPSSSAKRLQLIFPETRTVLSTDRALFSQLLQNLIGNALKYTERGQVRISQRFDADCLIVRVEDTGIGIPEDKLDRIFDEYYQVNPHGGLRLGVGLGLAIVREVSRLLGLLISVTSKLGEGTKVSVRIPRQKLLPDDPAPSDPPSAAPVVAVPLPGRVILLEDNHSVRAATELFLTLEGYRILSAGSVAEAQELFADVQPGDLRSPTTGSAITIRVSKCCGACGRSSRGSCRPF